MTITDDFQLELRDLLMGTGTEYGLSYQTCINWWDLAEVRTSDIRMPGRHGILAGDDLYGGLALSGEIIVQARGAALVEAIDDLKAAFAASDVDLPLYGQMFGQQRLRWVRPRRLAVTPASMPHGVARVQVQLMVVDPFAYSVEEHSGSTSLSVIDEGLVFPVTFPVTFGEVAGGAGSLLVVNDGLAPASWRAALTGPLEDPSIENVTTGQSFGLSGVIDDGDTLYLDSRARTILLNGTVNRSAMRAPGVQWFDLVPGANTIRFDAAGDPPYGDLTMTWRSAWH